jgi:uncharacterized membrane protein (UPF0127 family)
VRSRSWLLAVPVLAVAVALPPGAASRPTATKATALLTLDGVSFRPELAMNSGRRSFGLMERKRAPADGMLFVFPEDTTGGFWMKNTLVPLKIVFFNSEGRRVRRMFMTPCKADESCPTYDPGRRYRYALELRASDTRPAARIGPLTKLRQLSRRSIW